MTAILEKFFRKKGPVHNRRTLSETKESFIGNLLMRFLSVACFELLLCSLINVRAYAPSAPGGMGTYMISIAVFSTAFALMVAIASLYFHNGPYIAGTYEKGSLL